MPASYTQTRETPEEQAAHHPNRRCGLCGFRFVACGCYREWPEGLFQKRWLAGQISSYVPKYK